MSSNTHPRTVRRGSRPQTSAVRSPAAPRSWTSWYPCRSCRDETPHRLAGPLGILLLALGAVWGSAVAAQDMSQQLQQLSRENGFTVVGIQKLGASPARQSSGTVKEQIKALLENYNHILVGDGSGGVERLIILGPKQPLPDQPATQEPADEVAEETVLTTLREDLHHLVEGVLVGVNGTEVPTKMTVDTGASFVVLPESLGQRLGYKMEELETREVKTANGPASARIGKLPTVRLGSLAVNDVEIAFIPDQQLGGSALLGMSALGRFQITLDDEQNQLTLRPKN